MAVSSKLVAYPPRNHNCVCHIAARLHGNWDACWARCAEYWRTYDPRVMMDSPYCRWSCFCDRLTVRENVSCCGPEVLR